MSYFFPILPTMVTISFQQVIHFISNVENLKWSLGAAICTLYVEKKIFYFAVLFAIKMVFELSIFVLLYVDIS
jgi:hypothetical protein